ncbi:MAG: hypothetical protein H7Z12_06070 [Rhodospirillaceae bacterium]|nr:hypothetical protein [Rhodospirillales bacterium]
MADVVQFFLKMAEDGDDLTAPYLLSFGLERAHIGLAGEAARPILDAIKEAGEFADDSQAAEYGLSDAIVANGHLDPEVQHVMAPVVVFLATDTPDKLAAIAAGATRLGFVLTPGKVPPKLEFRFVTA